MIHCYCKLEACLISYAGQTGSHPLVSTRSSKCRSGLNPDCNCRPAQEAHEAAQRKMEKQREKEREQEGKQAERRNSHQPSQRELLAAAAEARRAGSASQEVCC